MKIIIKIIFNVIGILLLAYIAYVVYMLATINRPTVIGPGLSPYYSGTDYDGTYIVEGQKIVLDHGKSEYYDRSTNRTSPLTRYFGNGVKADFDQDGRIDDAFLITQETGGSGTFYYFVARLNKATGPVGSEAIFIGDRIAPQSTSLDNGKTTNGTNRENVIVVNYADRNPNESMAVRPSLGKSIWLKLDLITMKFGEVAQNFEGESNR